MNQNNSQSDNALNQKLNIICGRDLKLMRLAAEITTTGMAQAIGVKSRKTVENWEAGTSTPTVNQWLRYCQITGFDAARVVTAALKRNESDPTQAQDINLYACQGDAVKRV